MEVLRHPWERVHARVWTIETTSINAECARVSRVCPALPPVSPVQRHRGEPDTLTLQVQDRSAPGLRLLSRPRIRFSVVAKSRAGVLVGLDGREASV